jgi:hypothetical protein
MVVFFVGVIASVGAEEGATTAKEEGNVESHGWRDMMVHL